MGFDGVSMAFFTGISWDSIKNLIDSLWDLLGHGNFIGFHGIYDGYPLEISYMATLHLLGKSSKQWAMYPTLQPWIMYK